MFYKLLITSLFICNITNCLHASCVNDNYCNKEIYNNTNISNINTTYISKNNALSQDLNIINKDNLSNQNSSSLNSIASTNSNVSNNRTESIDSQDQGDYILQESPLETNKIFTYTYNDTNPLLPNTLFQGNNKIYDELERANKCFKENCGLENLDIIKGKKHLLTLYSYFDEISNKSKNKLSNKQYNDNFNNKTTHLPTVHKKPCILFNKENNNFPKVQSSPNIYNNKLETDLLPIDKFNNRFCIFMNIVYGFLKTSKECKYNINIEDDYIKKIEAINYIVYYENGLFTKDKIIEYFDDNKETIIEALDPLLLSINLQ